MPIIWIDLIYVYVPVITNTFCHWIYNCMFVKYWFLCSLKITVHGKYHAISVNDFCLLAIWVKIIIDTTEYDILYESQTVIIIIIIIIGVVISDIRTPPLWSSGQNSWLQMQRTRVWFPALPDFLRNGGSGTGPIQPREDNWGATWKESSGSGL
jgi:hypothetical protein